MAARPAPPPVPISITICGDGGCGKSSITLRLVHSQWTNEYDPTIEDSYSLTRRIDGVTYHLALTDTAGQEEYRGMWASTNLSADAFLMVYDITSPDSLDALQYFDDLVSIETETRLDNADRAKIAGVDPLRGDTDWGRFGIGGGVGGRTVPPIKIVAGNKCDLAEDRRVPASVGLDWARRHGCGFMETSARLEVNIEETFALIVRRVVEARRQAAAGLYEDAGMNSRGMTKPLTPIPGARPDDGAAGDSDGAGGRSEKRAPRLRGPNINGDRVGRPQSGFWRSLRCW